MAKPVPQSNPRMKVLFMFLIVPHYSLSTFAYLATSMVWWCESNGRGPRVTPRGGRAKGLTFTFVRQVSIADMPRATTSRNGDGQQQWMKPAECFG